MNKKWFTDRRRIIDILRMNLEDMNRGAGNNIALIGIRRIGKTQVINRFRELYRDEVIMPKINIQSIVSSPEIFALNYIGRVCYEFARFRKLSFTEDYDPTNLLVLCSNLNGTILNEMQQVVQELQKAKPNQHFLFSKALNFPEVIAKSANIPVLMCLDEFQDILELKTYREVRNVLAIFRSVAEEQEATNYLISGSAIRLMEKILRDPTQPFFSQFNILRLDSFTKEDSYKLATRIFRTRRMKYSGLQVIYKYSGGHPFYITAICEQASLLARRLEDNIEEDIVTKAFLEETLSPDGRIYLICDYIHDTSLKRVQGGLTLKTILNLLAREEGLTLTQIAEGMYRPTGQVYSYLVSLIESDLIIEENGRYYFRDPILRFWLAKTILGLDIDYSTDFKMIRDLTKEFEEKYLRASTELGKAKEFEFKAKLEDKFKIRLRNYLSSDGQIEFDLTGERNNIYYIFEIKWRNKPASYIDLRRFLEKVGDSEFSRKSGKLFFISKAGFTVEALNFAHENQIAVSDGSDF